MKNTMLYCGAALMSIAMFQSCTKDELSNVSTVSGPQEMTFIAGTLQAVLLYRMVLRYGGQPVMPSISSLVLKTISLLLQKVENLLLHLRERLLLQIHILLFILIMLRL